MALDDIPQIDEIDGVLDDLDSPSTLDVFEAMLPYEGAMVAAAAAKRALAGGGGGGGSQPPTPFVQADDPGAVGAGAIWVDTSGDPPVLRVRNAADDDWGGAISTVAIVFNTEMGGAFVGCCAPVDPIDDPSTATAEDCANAINALISNMIAVGLMQGGI